MVACWGDIFFQEETMMIWAQRIESAKRTNWYIKKRRVWCRRWAPNARIVRRQKRDRQIFYIWTSSNLRRNGWCCDKAASENNGKLYDLGINGRTRTGLFGVWLLAFQWLVWMVVAVWKSAEVILLFTFPKNGGLAFELWAVPLLGSIISVRFVRFFRAILLPKRKRDGQLCARIFIFVKPLFFSTSTC